MVSKPFPIFNRYSLIQQKNQYVERLLGYKKNVTHIEWFCVLTCLQSYSHLRSHLLFYWPALHWCSLAIRGCPSPTVTQPHLLHLAWSLMQNEALTLYQSVKAMPAITLLSLAPIYSLMFRFTVLHWWLLKTKLSYVSLNKWKWIPFCSLLLWSIMHPVVNFLCDCIEGSDFTGTTKEKISRVVSIREDSAQQERSILI